MVRADAFQTATCMRRFQETMLALVQDHDFVRHGRALAELVLSTEYSVPAEGGFQVEDPRTGRRVFDACGLPFVMWIEALPYCAGRLRETGAKGDADLADILELKVPPPSSVAICARAHAPSSSS